MLLKDFVRITGDLLLTAGGCTVWLGEWNDKWKDYEYRNACPNENGKITRMEDFIPYMDCIVEDFEQELFYGEPDCNHIKIRRPSMDDTAPKNNNVTLNDFVEATKNFLKENGRCIVEFGTWNEKWEDYVYQNMYDSNEPRILSDMDDLKPYMDCIVKNYEQEYSYGQIDFCYLWIYRPRPNAGPCISSECIKMMP